MPERPQPAEAVKVFFSYAHEDAELCLRLQQHFSFLKREKKIAEWIDKEIKPGQEWRGEIDEHLNSADAILLLISAAFADSDFCYNVETGRAMERHDAGKAVVVPIILHPCDWQKESFAKLQALPVGGKAISKWSNVEEALYEVARGIREVVEDLIAKRSAGSEPTTPEERITPPRPQPSDNTDSKKRISFNPPNQNLNYTPDELSLIILEYIYRTHSHNPVADLSEELNIDRLELETRLDDLLEYNYAERIPVRGRALRAFIGHRLTPKGKKCLLESLFTQPLL